MKRSLPFPKIQRLKFENTKKQTPKAGGKKPAGSLFLTDTIRGAAPSVGAETLRCREENADCPVKDLNFRSKRSKIKPELWSLK